MTPEPGMPVTVTIEGQPYVIRFTLRTLKTLQKDHGIALLRGGGEAMLDPEKLAVVLYHGLRENNASITLDWVEDHVDSANLIAMVPALSLAIGGQSKTASPNAAGPSLIGTGSLSGPSEDTTSVLVNGRSGG